MRRTTIHSFTHTHTHINRGAERTRKSSFFSTGHGSQSDLPTALTRCLAGTSDICGAFSEPHPHPAAAPCDMPHFAATRRKTLAPQAIFFRDSRYICGFSLIFEPRIMHAAFGRRSKIEKSPHAVSTRADPPPPSATLHRAASLEKMSAEAAAARIERSHAPATRGVPAVSVEESPRRCVSAVKHRRRRF